MPYKTNADLPDKIKNIPEYGQTIFRKTFNASFNKYGEEKAFKIAWNAVKKVFEKENGKWILKEKKEVQSFITLHSIIQAFSQNDIISKIPKEILNNIYKKNKHPFLQMYSIAHEGTSIPKILDKSNFEENHPITWTRTAIQSIANVINKGIKFFNGHNKTNENITQPEVGEVIHAFQEEINGKLHQFVIGFFPDKEKVLDKDICSQEASWTLVNKAGKVFAETCNKITGIALENSKIAQPAFKEAKRFGMVQAFINPWTGPGKGEKKMTFQEIQQAIKDLNVFPSQLYTEENLKQDRKFSSFFDELGKLKKDKDELEINFKKVNDEIGILKRSNNLNSAKDRIKNKMLEKNIPDTIKSFIDSVFEEDKNNLEDLSDTALSDYIDKEVKIYQHATRFLSGKDVFVDFNNGDDKAKKGTETDFLKKENNEFLED